MKETNFWDARDEMEKMTKELLAEIKDLYISQESLEARVKSPKNVEAQLCKLMNDHGTKLEQLVQQTRVLADKLDTVMSKTMSANGY